MTETIRWMVDDMGRIPGALWARIEPQGIFGKSDLSKNRGLVYGTGTGNRLTGNTFEEVIHPLLCSPFTSQVAQLRPAPKS